MRGGEDEGRGGGVEGERGRGVGPSGGKGRAGGGVCATGWEEPVSAREEGGNQRKRQGNDAPALRPEMVFPTLSL